MDHIKPETIRRQAEALCREGDFLVLVMINLDIPSDLG